MRTLTLTTEARIINVAFRTSSYKTWKRYDKDMQEHFKTNLLNSYCNVQKITPGNLTRIYICCKNSTHKGTIRTTENQFIFTWISTLAYHMTLQWNASYTNSLYLRAQIDKNKLLKENLHYLLINKSLQRFFFFNFFFLLLLLGVGSKPAIA